MNLLLLGLLALAFLLLIAATLTAHPAFLTALFITLGAAAIVWFLDLKRNGLH